jgi:hypothetical protein
MREYVANMRGRGWGLNPGTGEEDGDLADEAVA